MLTLQQITETLKDVFVSLKEWFAKIQSSIISLFPKKKKRGKATFHSFIKPEFVKEFIRNKKRKEEVTLAFSLGLLLIALLSVVSFFSIIFSNVPEAKIVAKNGIYYEDKPQIIAGQIVRQTKTIPVSIIKSGQSFIKLPKSVSNVVVKTISKRVTPSKEVITLGSRQQFIAQAKQSIQIAKINPLRSALGSVLNYIKRATASVETTVDQLVSQLVGGEDTDVVQTPDAVFVDVGNLVDQAPSISEEQPVVETPATEEVPASPEVTPAEPETTPITEEQPVVEEPIIEETPTEQPQVEVPAPEVQFVTVEYETPAPEITEVITNNDPIQQEKEVTISAPDELQYTNVLAFTELDDTIPIDRQEAIKIFHELPDGTQEPTVFTAYDLNNNGFIDYIEWIVPHLSTQTYTIVINITGAWHLDASKELISDIYDQTKAQDGVWSETVNSGEYVRAVFEKELTSVNDITLYAKSADGNPAQVEVYEKNGKNLITTFNITDEAKYKLFLTNLPAPTDSFDLRVIGSVNFDLITDPEGRTLYWVGNAFDNINLATGSAWKTTDPSGCGGGDAGSAPTVDDTIIFDGDCDNDAVAMSDVSVAAMTISAGYDSTIYMTSAITVAGNLSMAGGNINPSDGILLTINGTLLLSGGNIWSNGGQLLVSAGSINQTGGSIYSDDTGVIGLNGTYAGSGSFTLTGVQTCSGDLRIGNVYAPSSVSIGGVTEGCSGGGGVADTYIYSTGNIAQTGDIGTVGTPERVVYLKVDTDNSGSGSFNNSPGNIYSNYLYLDAGTNAGASDLTISSINYFSNGHPFKIADGNALNSLIITGNLIVNDATIEIGYGAGVSVIDSSAGTISALSSSYDTSIIMVCGSGCNLGAIETKDNLNIRAFTGPLDFNGAVKNGSGQINLLTIESADEVFQSAAISATTLAVGGYGVSNVDLNGNINNISNLYDTVVSEGFSLDNGSNNLALTGQISFGTSLLIDVGNGTFTQGVYGISGGTQDSTTTLIGDGMELGTSAGSSINVLGTLTIKPETTNATVGIGDGSPTGTFNLSDQEILAINSNCTSLTIGAAGNTGALDINNVTFNTDTTINGGTATDILKITTVSNKAVTVNFNTAMTDGNTTADNFDLGTGALTLVGGGDIGASGDYLDVKTTGAIVIGNSSGIIYLNSTGDSTNLGNVTTSATFYLTSIGAVAQSGVINALNLSVIGSSTVNLGGANAVTLMRDSSSVGDFSFTNSNASLNVDGDISVTSNGTIAINCGTGTYSQYANRDLTSTIGGAITITADVIQININSGNNPFATSGTLTLKPSTASTTMSLGGGGAFDLSADEISTILTGATGPIVIGSTSSTGALTIGAAVAFTGKTLTLNAGSITDGGKVRAITATTLTLNAYTGDIGASFASAIDFAVTTVNLATAGSNNAYVESASASGYAIGTSTVGGKLSLFNDTSGAITQAASTTITAGTLAINNTVGATTLDSTTNAITHLGTINATGQTVTLKNTLALDQTGAVTAGTLSVTDTGGGLNLGTQTNAIQYLGVTTLRGVLTITNGNTGIWVTGNVDTTYGSGSDVSINCGSGLYQQSDGIAISAGAGNITITTNRYTPGNTPTGGFVTTGTLSLLPSGGTNVGMALGGRKDLGTGFDADPTGLVTIGAGVTGVNSKIIMGKAGLTGSLNTANIYGPINFSNTSFKLQASRIKEASAGTNPISAVNLEMITNGTSYDIGASGANLEIDVAVTGTLKLTTQTGRNAYIKTVQATPLVIDTSSVTGTLSLADTGGSITQYAGSTITVGTLAISNSVGATTLDSATNAISALGTITATGQTVTLVNTATTTQSGVLTAGTFVYTNTSADTTLTQSNAIGILGTINAAGRTFNLKNTVATTQTGVLTAGTFVYTNTSNDSTLTQSNVISTLGTINCTNMVFRLTNTVATTQTGVLTAAGFTYINTLANTTLDQNNAISGFNASAAGRTFTLTNTVATTQTGALTAATFNYTNTSANTTLNQSNVISALGTINATGRTFTLTNTAATTQTGVLTASTFIYTNTSANTTLDQQNAISALGTIDVSGRTFTLVNTVTTTQSNPMRADTFIYTNTSADTTLSSVFNTINALGTINTTGRTFTLNNSTNTGTTTQSGPLTATTFVYTNTGGTSTLDNANNNITNLSTVSASGKTFTLVDKVAAGLNITGAIGATTVNLTNSGPIYGDGSSTITATTLNLTADNYDIGGFGSHTIPAAVSGGINITGNHNNIWVTNSSTGNLTVGTMTNSASTTIVYNKTLVLSGDLVTTGSADIGLTAEGSSNTVAGITAGGLLNFNKYTTSSTFTPSSNISTGGNLVVNAGSTLTMGSHNISVGGNWANNGAFSTTTGAVTFNGTNQSITGDTTFYNLTKSVTTARTLTFASGSTTSIAAGGTITLNGIAGNLLSLRSNSTPTQWKLSVDPTATLAVSYVDVKDSDALVGVGKQITGSYFTSSGNNLNWVFTPPTVALSSATANSSTQITVVSGTATDNSGSGLDASPYQFQETTGNPGATSSGWQSSTTHVDSGLTPNTQYTYEVRAKDATGNISNYSSTLSATTQAVALGGSCTTNNDCGSHFCGTDNICGGIGAACTVTADCALDIFCSFDETCNADINYGDVTPPTNIGISSTTADTTTGITVVANTATDSESGLHATAAYQFKRDTTELGWQASNTLVDTPLNPGTIYAYRVQARDVMGNVSAYSLPSSKYTLANIPSSLTLSADSLSQITATWTANSNPSGTQYYIENTSNNTNSGWVTSLFWSSSGLTCDTNYAFRVKARNGNDAETSFTDVATIDTKGCGGSGLPSGAYVAPVIPAGGFSVFINNNDSITENPEVVLLLKAGSDVERMAISNNPEFTNAVQQPYQDIVRWVLPEGNGDKTVYVKFFTSYGQSSEAYSDSIYLGKKTIVREVIESTGNVAEGITKLPGQIVNGIGKVVEGIGGIIGSGQVPSVESPPIEEVVTKETPFVFRKQIDVLSVGNVETFILGPMPRELSVLSQKIPQLDSAFREIGVSRASDVSKLLGNNFVLPGLAEMVSLPGASMGTGGFAPAGVSIGDLTNGAKMKIPTEIVFARTGGGLIDQNINVSISQEGEPQQKIDVISNKGLQLIVKPEKQARAVTGYFLVKQRNSVSLNGGDSNLITASLLGSPKEEVANNGDRLVLQEFDYLDLDKDGIWIADIIAPAVDGDYEITTVIDYQDRKIKSTQTSLIVVVDPEGYIYYQKPEGQIRIRDSRVTLYWMNPETKVYEIWPAKKYQQTNPQVTDVTGKYSFLVPEGSYYITVEARGYTSYRGEEFEVKNGVGVHENIELKSSNWFVKYFDWKILVIILMFIFSGYIFYRDRMQKRIITATN